MTAKNAPIKFKFSLLPGDLINALAGVRAVCARYKTTAEIYLGLDIEWQMTDQVSQGRLDKITLTQRSMDFLRPLLLSQPWISKVESFEVAYPEKYNKWCEAFKDFGNFEYASRWYRDNQDEIVDLDKHHLMPIKLQYSNIFRWNFYVYPDMACDLSEPWLDIAPSETIAPDTIIINRTKRSQNPAISYAFLKQYEGRLLFAGYRDEWIDFCTMFDLKMPLLEVRNALELAEVIRSCSFFIGNQSMCFSIAEAMKIPRILEVCQYLPNVIPTGEKAYDIYFQETLQWYVKELACTQ